MESFRYQNTLWGTGHPHRQSKAPSQLEPKKRRMQARLRKLLPSQSQGFLLHKLGVELGEGWASRTQPGQGVSPGHGSPRESGPFIPEGRML